MKRKLVEQESDLEMLGEEAASLGLAYQDWGQDLEQEQIPEPVSTYVSASSLAQNSNQDLVQDGQNLLQGYALAEPTPIVRKANTGGETQKHGKRKLWITIIIILVFLALGGVGGWWLWQRSQAELVAEEPQDDLVMEPVYLNMLDLAHEDVVKTYDVIKKVTYAEPFMSFYPMGELTLDDLSIAQREILLGGEKPEILQDDNMTPQTDVDLSQVEIAMPQDGVDLFSDNYLHVLYLAEYDAENLYLSEVVVKTRPAACADEAETPDVTCMSYYNLSGKTLEITEDDLASGELQNRDEVDKYKWTFRKDGNNNYAFVKVARVSENSQN